MEIAYDFFKREKDGSKRRVESSSDGCGGANGDQRFDVFFAKAQVATENGCDSCADLHGGSFTAEWYAAGDRGGSAEEFSENGFQGDVAAAREECSFCLRNAAATRFRKIFEEEIAHSQ